MAEQLVAGWRDEPPEVRRIVGFVLFLLVHKQHIWKAYERDVCWFEVSPYQVVVVDAREQSKRIADIQIYTADPILGFDPPGQVARDSVLWWQENRGAVVWREPAGLFEAIGTMAPLEAIAWAAK